MTTRKFFDSIAGMGPVDVLALSLRARMMAVHGLCAVSERDLARSGDDSSLAGGGQFDSGEARGYAAGCNSQEETAWRR